MSEDEIFKTIVSGIKQLLDIELVYLSDKDKKIKIVDVDINSVVVVRDGKKSSISFDRFRSLAKGLQGGEVVHLDTLYKGGGNDRTIIETIVAHLPNVGYMKGKSGRNKNNNHKVIQWFDCQIHVLGETLDVSEDSFSALLSSSVTLRYLNISKPFILLAGISGTGKSRFIRKQAEATDSNNQNYKLISVRPDWHEPSDLLGYISRISGVEKYIVTDTLKFMVSAWRDACDLSGTNQNVLANKAPSDMNTFWLCLDEMNLAPVEQYFADYLSVIETREWRGDTYSCDPILKADVINLLGDAAKQTLRGELGLEDTKYNSLWDYFSSVGIPLPPNLIVAGTVNMDETTHGFSRKVIDRALTLDFGQFFPNEFDDFFEPKSRPVIFNFPTVSHASKTDLSSVVADPDGQRSVNFLKEINAILNGTMFELAYRALNELLISVVCINPKDYVELQSVWDDFLMTKVLPRIEGDDDKLRRHIDSAEQNILLALDGCIKIAFSGIYEGGNRPDFFRRTNKDDEPVEIACRSKKKLAWMLARLKRNGFTAFWP